MILITGRRNAVFFHSEHRQIPWLREIDPDPTVELNPETAKKLGIQAGDWVWIEGVRGKVKRKAKLTPTLHPGMAHALHGWWLPESRRQSALFLRYLGLECEPAYSYGLSEFLRFWRSAQ